MLVILLFEQDTMLQAAVGLGKKSEKDDFTDKKMIIFNQYNYNRSIINNAMNCESVVISKAWLHAGKKND